MWMWVLALGALLGNDHGVTLNLATKTSWDAIVPEYGFNPVLTYR